MIRSQQSSYGRSPVALTPNDVDNPFQYQDPQKTYFSRCDEIKKKLFPLDTNSIREQLLFKVGKLTQTPSKSQRKTNINESNFSVESFAFNKSFKATNKTQTQFDSTMIQFSGVGMMDNDEDLQLSQNNSVIFPDFKIQQFLKLNQSTRPGSKDDVRPRQNSSVQRSNKNMTRRMTQRRQAISDRKFHSLQDEITSIILIERAKNLDDLMKGNFDHFFASQIKLMSISVDVNDLKLLEYSLVNISELMLELKQFDRAVFFFNQLRLLYIYTLNPLGKCKVLQSLAECCTQIKQPDAALRYLKRSLQYAWFLDDYQQELTIYEKMALNYFYKGHLDKSQHFHQRALLGGAEQLNSPVRTLAIDNITEYTKSLAFTFTKMTSLLLTYSQINQYVHISVKQMKPFNNNTETIRTSQDQLKNTLYLNSKAKDLIENLLNFDTDFKNPIPTPTFSNKVEHSFVKMKLEQPPQVKLSSHIFSLSFYEKNKGDKDKRRANDPTIYKLPLDTKINIRQTSYIGSDDDLNLRLYKKMQESKFNYQEQLRTPISLNHWIKETQLFQRKRNSSTYRQILENIMNKNMEIWQKHKPVLQ